MKKNFMYAQCLSIRFVPVGLLLLLLATGCADETLLAPDQPEALSAPIKDGYPALEAEMEALKVDLEGRIAAPAKAGDVVVVPGGSADALAGAIAQVAPRGTVVLASGMHTESGTVEISQQVTIVGEAGAVLEVDTGSYPNEKPHIEPALYVLNAPEVVIWGVAIRPLNDQVGGAAILLENSPYAVVGETDLRDHQFGIVVQGGDHARIWKNKVVTFKRADESLEPFTPVGIVLSVGKYIQVSRNKVSNAYTGIFASDEKGLLTHNETYGNNVGVIFCKFTQMQGLGETIGAELTASGWTATNNYSHSNGLGYLFTDEANNNLLAENAANNFAFDVFLLGGATPSTHNHVVAGSHKDIRIRDCGVDNNVDGGARVPC